MPHDLPPAAAPWIDGVIGPLANSTLKTALRLGGQPYVVPEIPLVRMLHICLPVLSETASPSKHERLQKTGQAYLVLFCWALTDVLGLLLGGWTVSVSLKERTTISQSSSRKKIIYI